MNIDEQDSHDMARLAHGHDAALNDLMERYAQRIYHYLLRSLGNEEDAADLAQETFVRVYQSRSRFDPRRKFSTWLYTIANNLVRSRFRWRRRHPQVSMEENQDAGQASLAGALVDEAPAPGEALQQAERADAIKAAVARLPEELREPLVLSVYEGLSQAEIGQLLQCSPKAVETRIYRARKQLREMLGSSVATEA